jgi:CBS domain-containing protein
MMVEDLMSTDVPTCRPDDSLQSVAQIMWRHDCGAVPVVDSHSRVHGIISDRDICMAAYEQGRLLSHIRVWSACTRPVHTCRPSDSIDAAERLMRATRVRRLPVLDRRDRLCGIVALGDLAHHAATAEPEPSAPSVGSVALTLAVISSPPRRRAAWQRGEGGAAIAREPVATAPRARAKGDRPAPTTASR